MKTIAKDWDMLEALVYDEEFDISYFSIELGSGEKLVIEK